jgi:hypothetical protein
MLNTNSPEILKRTSSGLGKVSLSFDFDFISVGSGGGGWSASRNASSEEHGNEYLRCLIKAPKIVLIAV